MRAVPSIARTLAFLFTLGAAPAVLAVVEKSLRVEGEMASDGSQVTLQWWQEEPNGPDPVTVSRRVLGAGDTDDWTSLATVTGNLFTDTTTSPGIAYEYQVYRPARSVAGDSIQEAAGYWAAGVEVPTPAERGIVLLVIDDTLLAPLSGEIERLEMDLVGDGWQVVRRDQPRHDSHTSSRPIELRAWVQSEFAKNPSTPHALFLLGRVPYVLSGRDDPDGHEPIPHPTDLYYADVDGIWTDTLNLGGDNLAGDGLFDQNWVPSTNPAATPNQRDGTNGIEMMVGRVDLADLGAFEKSEVELLRTYLDRHHAWRHRRVDPPRNSYWDYLAFDQSPTERYGVTNISGPAFSANGSHDVEGQQGPALWGVDFGDWNGANYPGYSFKCTFAINFGSAKQLWHYGDNPMRAMLAQDWYVLTCGWGVRPNWYIHPMALGRTIGDVHRRGVNNRFQSSGRLEYLQHDDYGNGFRHAVWIGLMGDPTLHAFPVKPPTGLMAATVPGGVELTWSPPAGGNAEGYRVFRAPERLGPYAPIDGGVLQTGTVFTDPSPVAGGWYMVRALHEESTGGGSLHQLSQGIYARAGNLPPQVIPVTATTGPGQPVAIPLAAIDPDGDALVFAKAAEAEKGRVVDLGNELVYIPDPDTLNTTDTVRVSLWDGTHALATEIEVTVQPPTVPPSLVAPGGVVAAREGDAFVLEAEFTGDLPMAFQWFKDGAPLADGSDYQGTATASLRIVAASAADGGDYHVELTNPVGSTDNAASPWRVVVVGESIGDSLVLHYDFDEGTGSLISDRSPSGEMHDLTLPGAIWSPGRFGSALGDPGGAALLPTLAVADSADLDFEPLSESFTISLWLRTTDAASYAGIFHKEVVNPDRRQFKIWTLDPPTRLQFYAGDAEGKLDTAVGGPPLDDGSWHLLTFVNFNDGGVWKARLYFDDGSRSTEILSGPVLVPGEPLRISAANAWRGQIDDLRIYRRALTSTEVATLWQGGMPPVESYAEWASAISWGAADSSPAADPDGDGVSNEMEYRLGRDPLVATPLYDRLALDSDGGGDWFSIDYRRRTSAPREAPWLSSDLELWSPLVVDGEEVAEQVLDPDPLGNGEFEDIRLRLRRDTPRRFLRLHPYR